MEEEIVELKQNETGLGASFRRE